MPHIIIEGTDKCGKSTLALELAKAFYMPVINRIKPVNNIYDDVMYFLNYARESYIIDRLHMSEVAYGPVKRGISYFDAGMLDKIEDELLSLKTINIYCFDSIENIKERCERMGEDFIVGSEIDKVLNNFNEAIPKSKLTWYYYSIGDSIPELIARIKREHNI